MGVLGIIGLMECGPRAKLDRLAGLRWQAGPRCSQALRGRQARSAVICSAFAETCLADQAGVVSGNL